MPSRLPKLRSKSNPAPSQAAAAETARLPAGTRNIRLILEYDGAAFFGFQKQPRHHTVQAELEKALSRILNGRTVIKAASGRTDTGVHARHQVVNFYTERLMPVSDLMRALNGVLPKTVAVLEAEEAPVRFHARYDARGKVYEYRIWNARVRSPLEASRSWHIAEPLNLTRIRRGIALLKGRHDFRSFCAAHGGAKTTVRHIRRFTVRKAGNALIFRVEADGFLYHMVRNLVGTLVEIGRGQSTPQDIKAVLAARDRKRAGRTAPAQGLTLVDVIY